MKEITLSRITCEDRWIEVVNTINSLFSHRIIAYIFTDHFIVPQGTYYLCCTPQTYVDKEWPHMKSFMSMNKDKTVAIVLPLDGVQNADTLHIKYADNQLVIKYFYKKYDGLLAMTFYKESV